LPEPRITLRTIRNCYLLDVDDEGYMYYGVDDLIKGFFMHAGLGRPNAMTGPQMDYMLNAIKEGTAVVEIQREAAKYRREVKKLKYRVAQLEMKLKKYEW
jgi:hypothetical protein